MEELEVREWNKREEDIKRLQKEAAPVSSFDDIEEAEEIDQLNEKRGQTRRKLKRTSRPEYKNREVTSDMSKLLLINYYKHLSTRELQLQTVRFLLPELN